MAKFEPIRFDPSLAHVLCFRHGPRAAPPPAGNSWDYWRMLSQPDAPAIAKRTVGTYFPDLVPAALRCSQIPRSAQTLGLLWPDLVSDIRLDRRLGIEFEDVPQWRTIDARADAYNMSAYEQYEMLPALIDLHGIESFNAGTDLATEVEAGRVGVMCSHVPIADAFARYVRKVLTFTENDCWLPVHRFEPGAFVHVGYRMLDFKYRPVFCEYHQVPTE